MKILTLSALMLTVLNGFTQRDNLYPYSPDGKKWGFVDSSLRVVIKPLYENELGFFDGLTTMTVLLNKKKGLLNKNGKLILPCIYDDIMYEYVDGIAVMQNKKFGVVSLKTGKPLLPVIYDEFGTGSSLNEALPVRKDNKWGVVNYNTWKQVGKLEFDNIDAESCEIDNTAIVKKQLKYGMMNTKTGAMILPVIYDELSYKYDRNTERYFVLTYRNNIAKKFDGNGKPLKQEKRENDAVGEYDDTKIDTKMAETEENISNDNSSATKNLYFYKTGDKEWKVTIEKRSSAGTEVFENFQLHGYDTISKFGTSNYLTLPIDQNKLKVKRDGKTGVVNLKGEVLVNTNYDEVEGGYRDFYQTRLDGLYGFIHKISLKEIRKPAIKKMGNYSYNNLIKVEMPAGQIGYMDWATGKIYIPGIKD
jgi:WG containing repeat